MPVVSTGNGQCRQEASNDPDRLHALSDYSRCEALDRGRRQSCKTTQDEASGCEGLAVLVVVSPASSIYMSHAILGELRVERQRH